MPAKPSELKRFSFMRLLPRADLERIAARVQRHKLPARALIFSQGERGDRFYMILSGEVEIFTRSPDGEERLNRLCANEWFGELSLIDGQPRSGSARTTTPSVLLSLQKEDFNALIASQPLVLHNLVTGIQHVLRQRDRAYMDELQRHNARLHQLYESSLEINRRLDLSSLFTAITARAAPLLESVSAELYLVNPETNELVPQTRPGKGLPCRPSAGIVGRAYIEGRAVNQTRRQRGQRPALAAPIRSEHHNHGVLMVCRRAREENFDERDEELLQLLANHAAIALENAELLQLELDKVRLDGELSAARQVQRSFIPPRPPRVQGLKIAALWRPAREVSGDYYDFIPLARRHWGFVIADVSDKGMPAALFMASTRSIIRASASAALASGTRSLRDAVADAVLRANRAITLDATRGMFVTLFLGVIDPKSGNLTYVNAGHNYPLVWRAQTRTLEQLESGDLALGALPGYPYTVHETRLGSGDFLALYTDGVTEAFNAHGTLFGENRFRASLRRAAARAPHAIVQAIEARLHSFVGEHPYSDDVTLVVVKRA